MGYWNRIGANERCLAMAKINVSIYDRKYIVDRAGRKSEADY